MQNIVFRVTKEIPTDVEMLVYYGADYAKQLKVVHEVRC